MIKELTRIAQLGGDHALRRKSDTHEQTAKADDNWNFATEVDGEAQGLMVAELHRSFPGIPILGEEQEKPVIPGPTYFVLDPIDGTIPYNAGFPNWGTIVSYMQDGQPHAGVIYMPEQTSLIVTAERGNGCYLNGQRVVPRPARPRSQAIICVEIGPWTPDEAWPQLNRLRKIGRWLGGSGFAAASLVDLITQRGDLYLNFRAKIWDFAAGAVAVQEIGGSVCNLNGEPLQWNQIDMTALFAHDQSLANEVVALLAA